MPPHLVVYVPSPLTHLLHRMSAAMQEATAEQPSQILQQVDRTHACKLLHRCLWVHCHARNYTCRKVDGRACRRVGRPEAGRGAHPTRAPGRVASAATTSAPTAASSATAGSASDRTSALTGTPLCRSSATRRLPRYPEAPATSTEYAIGIVCTCNAIQHENKSHCVFSISNRWGWQKCGRQAWLLPAGGQIDELRRHLFQPLAGTRSIPEYTTMMHMFECIA